MSWTHRLFTWWVRGMFVFALFATCMAAHGVGTQARGIEFVVGVAAVMGCLAGDWWIARFAFKNMVLI